MKRSEALKALREKVRAGRVYFPCSEKWRAVGIDGDLANAANVGSFDAAKALHEAALLGHEWLVREDEQHGGFANVITHNFASLLVASGSELRNEILDGAYHPEYAETPARAWLLAILSALIAQEEAA